VDELVKTLLLQTPAIGVLLMFTIQLYRDMRTDAKEAANQRDQSIQAIKLLSEKMDIMIALLGEQPYTKATRTMNGAGMAREGADTVVR
jgi:hypothetical protein